MIALPDSCQPNKSAGLRHVELITGSSDAEIFIRFIDDTKTGKPAIERKGTLENLWAGIIELQHQHYGVFLIPNADTVAGGFVRDEDITTIRVCFIDADHITEPDAWHRTPAFLVRTSPSKFHAYWIVDDLLVSEFAQLQRQLAVYYGSDPAVSNPSRIMRLAGSIHWKNINAPHLVTLDDRSVGCMSLEVGCTATELRIGLPPLEEKKAIGVKSPATGQPVSAEYLQMLLGYIPPDIPRIEWIKIIAGIRKTPLPEDANEDQRRQIAHEWSEGKLDQHNRYKDETPSRYTSSEDVDQAFDTLAPNKHGGVGYGTIFKIARDYGYDGPPERLNASEAFSNFAENRTLPRSSPKADHKNLFSTRAEDKLASPPTWLVEGLIPDDSAVMIVAPSKHLKSFIAIAIGGSIATGRPLFGKYPTKRKAKVFYGAGEGGLSIRKKRLPAWEIANGFPPYSIENFHIASSVPTLNSGTAEGFIRDARVHMQSDERGGLFICDTVNRALNGADEDSSATASRYLNMDADIRGGIGGSSISIHHMGKDIAKGARGSSAFYAGFDTVIVIDKAVKDDKTGEYFLTAHVDKQKDGEDGLIFYLRARSVLTPDGPSLVIEAASEDDAKRAAGKHVGLRPTDVGAALKARGAYPGGANEWNEGSSTGGIDTRCVATQIAQTRAEASGTLTREKDINVLVATLNRGARDDGLFAPYVVRENQSKRQWAITLGVIDEAQHHV